MMRYIKSQTETISQFNGFHDIMLLVYMYTLSVMQL